MSKKESQYISSDEANLVSIEIQNYPIGVAALSSPNIFATMFIIIDPVAGWPFGSSGNSF